jgi:hypothetical protein
MNTMTVQIVQRISVVDDGSLIEMDIKGELGERALLTFSLDGLGRFLQRATQSLIQARNRKQTKDGHPHDVLALATEGVRANSIPGGSKVMLSTLAGGLEFHFLLDLPKAGELQVAVARALEDANAQAKQTRQ